MAPPDYHHLQVKQRKSNHKLRRLVQPLAAFSAHEHDAVGRALLSSVTTSSSSLEMSIAEALDRIAIWKLRSTCLPHAVESTAALAQVLRRIHNRQSPLLSSSAGSASSSLLELQHTLACAVLRTVNGLADALQQQRAFAASVAVLCRELGIPSWLVDIRHAATHNQLPSLPVLQLAAEALLRYLQTVYWEPWAERRQEQYRQAVDLLRVYNDRDGAQHNASSSTVPSLISNNDNDNNENQQVSVDKAMESSESESDSEDFNTLVRSMLPIAGTNGNRFALLLDDGKKNKAKRQAAATLDSPESLKTGKFVAGTPASVPKKRKVKTKSSTQRQYDATKSACCKLFIRSKLPLDIKYEAALDFLLGDNGVLLPQPTKPLNGNTNSFNFTDLQVHYETLLVALCCAWPGFLAALLIRSVNLVLAHGAAADDPSAAEHIVQWIQYWLSSTFICSVVGHGVVATPTIAAPNRAKISGDSKNGKNCSTLAETTVLAPWSMLQAAPLRLPLNSLCDRCEAFTTATSAADSQQLSSVAAMKQLFEEILGDQRCANFGVANNTFIRPYESVSHAHDYHDIIHPRESITSKAKSATDCMRSAQPSMSLEAMEALLAEDVSADNDKADTPDNDFAARANSTHEHVSPRTAWVRCASWEPCSIGTLPGFGGCL